MSQKNVVFDEQYYNRIMKEFGYNPIQFEKINFSLGTLSKDDLQRRWLCHHGGDQFSEDLKKGKKATISTGLGISGPPHAGTLSQILRSITLQKAGIPVNLILGDLDAYNGKSKPLSYTLELTEKYREFILRIGFNPNQPSTLRSQNNSLEVLRTAYIIGHYMDDSLFNAAEEDLHTFYSTQGKVDSDMSYRRKLSLNLMTADFLHLGLYQEHNSVLVMLGVDEHKYVQFGKETLTRMKTDNAFADFNMNFGGMYTPLIRGFNGFPKMSKSFPDSGITANMPAEKIKKLIMTGEGNYDKPENNVVYQMISSASFFNDEELKEAYNACLNNDFSWKKIREKYADMLIDICSKWTD
ncbi:MAG: hypothetical protein ACP5N3_04025 [Candidatus Nanoarchaeia archaeon]